MILISLLIQVNLIDNKIKIKKFMYLIINDFERQNNIKKLIELMKIYDYWIAKEYKVHSIYISLLN